MDYLGTFLEEVSHFLCNRRDSPAQLSLSCGTCIFHKFILYSTDQALIFMLVSLFVGIFYRNG